MAKVTPGAELPGRGKSLRGRIYFRTFRGVLVAAKWPRPRGSPKTPEHQAQVDWFTKANKTAKRVDAKLQATIAAQTAGTPYMPRDLALSLMSGRTASISYPGGRYLRSFRAMADVSESLDVIGNTPGDTLVRGADYWTAVPTPPAGAQWINPGPELAWTEALSTGGQAFKGMIYTARAPISIHAVACVISLSSGGIYQGFVALVNGSSVIQAISLSPTQAPGLTGRTFLVFPCAMAFNVGERIAVMVGRTNAGNTHVLPVASTTNAIGSSLPTSGNLSARLAQAAPAVGHTCTTGVGAVYINTLALF